MSLAALMLIGLGAPAFACSWSILLVSAESGGLPICVAEVLSSFTASCSGRPGSTALGVLGTGFDESSPLGSPSLSYSGGHVVCDDRSRWGSIARGRSCPVPSLGVGIGKFG